MARMTPQQRAVRIKAVIKRDGPHCVWCSARLSATHADATVDHALPYAKNGSNRTVNLLLACDACNWERGAKSLQRFAKSKEKRGFAVQRELVSAAVERIERNRLCLRSVCAAESRGQRTKAVSSKTVSAKTVSAKTESRKTLSAKKAPARKPSRKAAVTTVTTAAATVIAKSKQTSRTKRSTTTLNPFRSSNNQKMASPLSAPRLGRSRLELVEELAWASAA